MQLFSVTDARVSELATVENVGAHDALLATERLWEIGLHVELKSPTGSLWGKARVVYCQAVGPSVFAVGLNLLTQTSDWEVRRNSFTSKSPN